MSLDQERPPAWFGRLESQFLRPYRGLMILGLLGLVVQSLLLLPIPLLQGWIVDRLLVGQAGVTRTAVAASRAILLGFLATVVCHLARMGLAWRIGAMMGRIGQEVVVALRGALHRKLLRLPMMYFDSQQTGRLMARVTSDVGAILSFLNAGSLQLVNDLIVALGIALLLVWLQWPLALVALVTVPLYVVNQRFFARRIHELSVAIRAEVATIYALLSERVSGVRLVRCSAKEEAELATLDERIDAHRGLSWSNTRANARLGAQATLINGLGTVFVVSVGALLVGHHRMSVGELLAFYTLIGQLYGPIVRLTQFQATAADVRVSVERLFEILDEPESVQDDPEARPIDSPRGGVEFHDVRFAYAPGGTPVLDIASLSIAPGTTVGLFGASGAGKSTLIGLIPRLYDLQPGDGTIRFDGQDVRSLRLADLRRAVALVPQQAILFEGTIRTNLLYAAPSATADQIRWALRSSDLATTVDALPLGLETPVGERGYSLSGGQRQRLALARALIADPSLLLLDDCTSALDAETEERIHELLRTRSPRRTCVIVSHKVASIRWADRIYVLESGKIVEAGTHEELLGLQGRYAAAYRQQIQAPLF